MLTATYDCKPTLSDSQVLEFCKQGYLMLPAVVPDDINRRTIEWLDAFHASGKGRQTHALLEEDWFVQHVVRNSEASGAMRSLLGANYYEPHWITWFRGEGPSPANQWHIDGGSVFGRELKTLKWFYLAADTTPKSGPTEFVAGSHHIFNQVRFMSHYDGIRGTWKAIGPAGSIYLTAYPLWHRRAKCTQEGIRYMLTSDARRTSPPVRDWIQEDDFDFAMADYWLEGPRFGEQFWSSVDNANMFCWLCGKMDGFKKEPGPSWPFPGTTDQRPFGVPDEIAALGTLRAKCKPTIQ